MIQVVLKELVRVFGVKMKANNASNNRQSLRKREKSALCLVGAPAT
jgi:hypothetical protein